MQRFMKIFLALALLINFSATCSAQAVGISEDGLETFLSKCNQIIKAGDPDSQLDMPTKINLENQNLVYYADTLQLDANTFAKITYALQNNKVYAIKLETNNYNDDVKNFFEGMSIIFLKASGLSDVEAENLSDGKGKTDWQNSGAVSRLKKFFTVKVQSSALTIMASDTNN